MRSLWLLPLLTMAALCALPWACSSNNSSNPAAPVTVVELVTATITSTPTATPTITPGGAATSTPVPPPVVVNGYFNTSENLPVTLSNATLNTLTTDPNGDPLIFIFPGSPNHGTVALYHAGYTNIIIYTPNAGFYGTDSFAFYVVDQVTYEDSTVQTMVITVATFTPTMTWTSTNTATPTITATPTNTPTPNATACATPSLFGPQDAAYFSSFSAGFMLFNPLTFSGAGGEATLSSVDVVPNLTTGNSVSLQCAVYDQITGDQLALSAPQSISGPKSVAVRFPVTPCTLIQGRTYLLACNIITASGFIIGDSSIVTGLYYISSGPSLPGNFTGSGATTIPTAAPDIYAEICP